MFPIYILDGKTELPKEGNYYIVCENGIFLHKDTGIIKATIKVDGISFLDNLNPSASMNIPKIDPVSMLRIRLFFRRIYRLYKSEAIILIYYNSDSREYFFYCPYQKVFGASVNYYDRSKSIEGFNLIGTIHSHINLGAFHSGTDKDDEKDFDGLHITLGHLDQPYSSMSSSMVVNNHRFMVDTVGLVRGAYQVDWKVNLFGKFRKGKPVKKVKKKKSDIPKVKKKSYFLNLPEDKFYSFHLPPEVNSKHIRYPRYWITQVVHDKPKYSKKDDIFDSENYYQPVNKKEGN